MHDPNRKPHQNQATIELLKNLELSVTKARDVPSTIFRMILASQHYNMGKWNDSMVRYLRDPRNRIPQNTRDMSSARGNLAKELVRNRMTWGVLMKALSFFNPLRVKLTFEVTWRTRKVNTFSLDIYKGVDLEQLIAERQGIQLNVIDTPVIDDSFARLTQQLNDIENL